MRLNRVAVILGVLFACVYAVHRTRYVHHCDSWAYFAQSQLFLGRDPGLHSFPNPLRHPALTPLGIDVARGRFVSAFPPGYSVLLAFAGLFGGEYWVNPFLGGLSVVLMYAAIAREASPSVALPMAVLWGICPLVAGYATLTMSDMAATVSLLGSYLLLRDERRRLGGLVFGLSMMIRPMSALFFGCAALLLPRRSRPWVEFALPLAAGALVGAAVQWHMWGALLSPTYKSDLQAFLPKHFVAQFPHYLRESSYHLGPVLALAVFEGARAPKRSLPEIAWVAAFFLIYPFAGPIDFDWTRPRFLLPAFPALFILAARAVTEILWRLHETSERALRTGTGVLLAAAVSWGGFCAIRSVDIGALVVHPARNANYDSVAAHLPKNALVGAVVYSGSLRLYAGVETFLWMHPQALAFARDEFARGRPVYMLLEPDEHTAPNNLWQSHRFAAEFALERVFELDDPGFMLSKMVAVRKPGQLVVELANPMNRWALASGWMGAREVWGDDYGAAACELATLELPLDAGVAREIDIVAAAAEGAPAGFADVSIQGRPLGRAVLGAEFTTSAVHVPKELAEEATRLDFHFPGAAPCGEGRRETVARVRSVEAKVL